MKKLFTCSICSLLRVGKLSNGDTVQYCRVKSACNKRSVK